MNFELDLSHVHKRKACSRLPLIRCRESDAKEDDFDFDGCYKRAERFICIFQVTLHLMLKSNMNQWKLTMVAKQAQLAVSSTTIRLL